MFFGVQFKKYVINSQFSFIFILKFVKYDFRMTSNMEENDHQIEDVEEEEGDNDEDSQYEDDEEDSEYDENIDEDKDVDTVSVLTTDGNVG